MIDLRIVNDLADNEEPLVFENFARRIGEIDRSLDAVTKTELFRETHGRFANFNDPALSANLVDDVAAVMLFDLLLHRGHHVRRAEVYFLARGRSARDEVRAAHAFGNVSTTRPIFQPPIIAFLLGVY